jgi:hypothetical protein
VELGFKNPKFFGGMKEQLVFPKTFEALRDLFFAEAKGLVFHEKDRTQPH